MAQIKTISLKDAHVEFLEESKRSLSEICQAAIEEEKAIWDGMRSDRKKMEENIAFLQARIQEYINFLEETNQIDKIESWRRDKNGYS